jgi:hypothetical protein
MRPYFDLIGEEPPSTTSVVSGRLTPRLHHVDGATYWRRNALYCNCRKLFEMSHPMQVTTIGLDHRPAVDCVAINERDG